MIVVAGVNLHLTNNCICSSVVVGDVSLAPSLTSRTNYLQLNEANLQPLETYVKAV